MPKVVQPNSFCWYQHVHRCFFFYFLQGPDAPLMSPADSVHEHAKIKNQTPW